MGARLLALLRFHLATAVPASLRALAPVAAAVTVAIMLQPIPSAAVTSLVVILVGVVDHPAVSLAVAAAAVALARAVGRRLERRRDDWLGHLPAATVEHRLAAAVACGLAPLVAAGAVTLLALPVAASGFDIRPVRLAALLAVSLPAGVYGALTGFPLRSAAAALAAWATLEGGVPGLALGPAVAVLLGASAGHAGLRRDPLRALPLPPVLAVTLRATGARPLGGAGLGAAVAACGAIFGAANGELPAWAVDRAAMLAGLLGIVAAATTVGESIARRRPPWPWARALPWSARQRVLQDAGLLAAVAAPALLVVLAWRPGAALPVVLTAPALVLAAAAAVRRQPGATFGAGLDVVLGGAVAAGWVAIVPLLAAAGPAAAWLALRWGTAREQRLSGVVLDPQLAFEAEEASR